MVGGILSQSSQLFSQGIWMNGEIVEEQYGDSLNLCFSWSGGSSSQLEESLSKDLAEMEFTCIKDDIGYSWIDFCYPCNFQAYLAWV